MSKPKIAVIISSTRPTRFGDKPATWIAEHAAKRGDIDVEIATVARPEDLHLDNADFVVRRGTFGATPGVLVGIQS